MSTIDCTEEDPLEENERARSNFVRNLVQRTSEIIDASSEYLVTPPKRIVQFWNDFGQMPDDVKECIESWKKLKEQRFELLLFDTCQARQFIRNGLGARYERAFDWCYHPAMQSDYFRLCYILKEGGCYVDADDVYHGVEVEHLFSDGRLKIQPLCYDISTGEMVSPTIFTSPGANDLSWIFYFNNNPLIAIPGHPVVDRALANATISLERNSQDKLPEVQSTTGPGNLTKSLFEIANDTDEIEGALLVLRSWEHIATTRWPLSYRDDERNWRLSNQRAYVGFGQTSVVVEE